VTPLDRTLLARRDLERLDREIAAEHPELAR